MGGLMEETIGKIEQLTPELEQSIKEGESELIETLDALENSPKGNPHCHLCQFTGVLYHCATCQNLTCDSCLNDADPVNCKKCSQDNIIEIKTEPLTEQVFDVPSDKVKTVTHKGRYFTPVGTAMMTTCGKISTLSDFALDEMLAQYAGFVKEAEESLDKRRIMLAMAKAEKSDRGRKKNRTGLSLDDLGIKLNPPRDKDGNIIRAQPTTTKKAKESNGQDISALAAQIKAAGITPEMILQELMKMKLGIKK
jgi:hypothetical protein